LETLKVGLKEGSKVYTMVNCSVMLAAEPRVEKKAVDLVAPTAHH
jgi:hypothetical protein